jgi:eukaryotic-like serine/threonine-protein kinase
MAAPPPSRRRPLPRLGPWLLSVLLFAAAVIGFGWAYAESRGPDTAEVPDVVGLQETADERVRNAGFRAHVNGETSTQPRRTVLRQVPEAGAELEKGAEVALFTSLGPPEIRLPALVGLRADAAERLLKTLELKATRSEVPGKAPAGVVVSQNPAAGSLLSRGAVVTLGVSRGPKLVAVPSVRGLPREQAVARLKAAGLVAVAHEVFSSEPRGVVVAQDPPGGKKVPRRTKVTINVSKGPGEVEVPDVQGLPRPEAAARLREVGLDASFATVSSSEPRGTVVSQDPTPGERVRGGAHVLLNVSNGAGSTTTSTTTVFP